MFLELQSPSTALVIFLPESPIDSCGIRQPGIHQSVSVKLLFHQQNPANKGFKRYTSLSTLAFGPISCFIAQIWRRLIDRYLLTLSSQPDLFCKSGLQRYHLDRVVPLNVSLQDGLTCLEYLD